MLELRLLGEIEVARDGQRVERLPPRKSLALLDYLAAIGRRHRRERLCSIFWDGPDDPRASLRWNLTKLRAVVDGTVLAESARALVLEEDGYPARVYFPAEDVHHGLLTATNKRTHCPWKGDAAYWTITVGDETLENGAWAYPTPLPELAAIAGYLSFYEGVTVEG